MRPLLGLTIALLGGLCLPTRAQVPLGHAVLATIGATTGPSLWLYEPLNDRFTPIDTTALPAGFQMSALHVPRDGQRLLIAGRVSGATSDIVLASGLLSNWLAPPTLFATGLIGRTLALWSVATTSQLVIVTNQAILAAAATGGVARPLTPIATDMGNVSGVLVNGAVVFTSAVDAVGQAILWRLDLSSLQLSSGQLRLAGQVFLADGPGNDSLLVGETTGQIWQLTLANTTRAPWVQLGRSPLRALWRYDDQLAWFAAVGTDLQRIDQQALGRSIAIPGGLRATDFAYRSYMSATTAYGTACPGTGARVPAIDAQGRPVPGNGSFALTLASGRPSSNAALLIGAVPTNIPLDAFGMPRCLLLTQPAVTLAAATNATGGAQVPIAIPPDPGLPGVRFFAQWVIVDLGANAASLVTSNGARVEI